MSKGFYKLSLTEMKISNGNFARVYSAERTLCDILKTKNHVDVQITNIAFKS